MGPTPRVERNLLWDSPTRPGRVQPRIPISLNRRRPLQRWHSDFFIASTRRSWVMRGRLRTGAREHSYFLRANGVHSRGRFVLFFAPKKFFSLFFSGTTSIRQARRVASRRVASRHVPTSADLHCRGNECSATAFHSNITVWRRVRLAIGVNDPGRENGGDFVRMIASVASFEARRDNTYNLGFPRNWTR